MSFRQYDLSQNVVQLYDLLLWDIKSDVWKETNIYSKQLKRNYDHEKLS